MPRQVNGVIFVLVLSLLIGCTTYTKVNTKQIVEFDERLKAQHEGISDLKVEYSPSSIDFNYSTEKKIGDKEVREIFYKTKALILSAKFKKEVIEEQFFAKYFNKKAKEARIYPKIYIRFDFSGDGKYDRMFESSYYKTSDVSNKKVRELVDGYMTWFYWDYKGTQYRMP